MEQISIAIIILIGFFAAFVGPTVHKYLGKNSGPVLALAPLIIFILALHWIEPVSQKQVLKFYFSWFPQMGINFSFLVDGLSLTFLLLISGIGTLIVFYSGGYLGKYPKLGRFYLFLLLFMAAMVGMVLSDNILTMFVFWELTSISSYMLIGFNHEHERSRYASLQALLITAGGGLAMFAGLLLLQDITGTYSISEMLPMAAEIQGHHLYSAVLILLLLGAFTKSAQFPFHFWLPNAMEAPTPVSAYLHSATMVKAGVFLLARFNPVMGGTESWTLALTITGMITMLLGAVIAVGQRDLKKILAYTTISSLGVLVMLIGIGTVTAITAAMGFLIVHSLYKGTLFLVAGAIDHETGTRDIFKLGGLFKYMPIVAIAAILAAFSNAGMPPFIGFIGKELIYEGTLEATLMHPAFITGVTVLANMFIVATAIMVGVKPFKGHRHETPRFPKEPYVSLWTGPIVLGAVGLLAGVLSAQTSTFMVSPAVNSVLGYEVPVKLELWHGFNFVLLLSGITLLGGGIIYYLRMFILKERDPLTAVAPYSIENLYNFLLNGMIKGAEWHTRILQNGNLRSYLLWVVFMFLGLCGITLILFADFEIDFSMSDIYFHEITIAIIIIMAGVVAIRSKTILVSIAALGIVGYGVALLFIFFGATDLAMTLFSIETLTVILFVLVIYKLPRFSIISSKKVRIRDKAIAIASGGMISMLMLFMLSGETQSRLSPYFLENSYTLAKGRNVVNVILVDFRAMDTLGEIVVLSVAAIGVFTLMHLKLDKNDKVKK